MADRRIPRSRGPPRVKGGPADHVTGTAGSPRTTETQFYRKRPRDTSAQNISRQRRHHGKVRWSVLTTKALSLPFRPQDGSKWRGVCLELDYRRIITLYMGAEHKKYKREYVVFRILAEFERELTSERTNGGWWASARTRGRKGGRKPKKAPIKLRSAWAREKTAVVAGSRSAADMSSTRRTVVQRVAPLG